MPIKIPKNLPARSTLEAENIFVIDEERALHQDIRPLEIALLNLMPLKIQTESQIARLLSNTPLQINLTLLTTGSYTPKNVPKSHLDSFYHTWEEVRHRRFDGLIVTGAPVEMMPFHEVQYWDELKNIFAWSREFVYSSFFICWAAQAALFDAYGIDKVPLASKFFGIFPHKRLDTHSPLLRGFDEEFMVPVSRHTTVSLADVRRFPGLNILSCSSSPEELYLAESNHYRQVYCFNHPEYDALTLKGEYDRDMAAKKSITLPTNYFPSDNPANIPLQRWSAHAHLLYSNWLNYCVYQETPYDLSTLAS